MRNHNPKNSQCRLIPDPLPLKDRGQDTVAGLRFFFQFLHQIGRNVMRYDLPLRVWYHKNYFLPLVQPDKIQLLSCHRNKFYSAQNIQALRFRGMTFVIGLFNNDHSKFYFHDSIFISFSGNYFPFDCAVNGLNYGLIFRIS